MDGAKKHLQGKKHDGMQELLLASLPHPAMLIRNSDKIILAANKIATDMGATIGGHCWQDFAKSKFISDHDREKISRNDTCGIKCTHCLAGECLDEDSTRQLEINTLDRILDVRWTKVKDDLYLH